MADAKPKIAEARQSAQPGRAVAERGMLDTMKTQAMIERFASYAPPGIDYKPLHASAVLAIAQQPLLQKAKPLTLVQAMMGVTRLGLAINTPEGHCYLIPFEMNGEVIIQVVIGYRGFIELAFRAGEMIAIGGDVATMPEWDQGLFKFQKGTEEFLRHTFLPTRIEGGDVPAFAYAVAKLKEGEKFDVMPWAGVLRIRDASQGYIYAKSKGDNSKTFLKNPWHAHEWPMGVKTVLRRMTKTMRLSAAMAQAVALDEMGEERDIDFGSVVDLDPEQWRDLTDAGERQQEGKAGEQHQVRTPEADKPKAETKKAEMAKASPTTTEERSANRAAAASKSEGGDPRPEPPMEGKPMQREAEKPAAQTKSPPPADPPRTNGADKAAAKGAADFWA